MLIAVILIIGLKKEGNWSLWRQSFGLEARKVTVQDSVSALSRARGSPVRAGPRRTGLARLGRLEYDILAGLYVVAPVRPGRALDVVARLPTRATFVHFFQNHEERRQHRDTGR